MAGKPQTLSDGQKKEVKALLRTEVMTWVLTALAIVGGIAGVGLWQIKQRVESKMERLVAEQFEEPRIQEVVQKAASERASQLLADQVKPEVAKFREDVANEVKEIQTLVDKTRELEMEGQGHKVAIEGVLSDLDLVGERIDGAEKRVGLVESNLTIASNDLGNLAARLSAFDKDFETLSEEQQFLALANKARLYSLSAFLELDRLSKTTNTFAADAGQIVWALRRDMEIDRTSGGEYVPIEASGQDYEYRGPFTSDEIAIRFASQAGVEGAANVVRKDKLKLFLPKLVELSGVEKNLWVQNRITYAISDLSEEKFFPWTQEALSDWWSSTGSKFTNWPFVECQKGIECVAATRYEEAASWFESVVIVDPQADMSRALAIASFVEVGNTNRANALNNSWRYSDGRWTQWAKAKLLLSNGEIIKASEEYAKISHQFKTFRLKGYIYPGNHILRQIDWSVFDQKLKDLGESKGN